MSSNDTKDLDFDELDKAVTSLMGGVKDKDLEAKENNLDINSTLGPDESPSYKHLGQVAGTIGSEAIDRPEQTVSLGDDASAQSSVVPPALKRSGRFMDVVHPSSDMRASFSSVSREGTTIKAPESLPPPDTTEGNLPSSGDEPVQAVATPDDIAPEETPEEEAPKAPEPLSSPFLPDTKVEKRPLGGLATEKALDDEKDEEPPKEELSPVESMAETSKEETASVPEMSSDKKDEDEFSKMDAMATEPAKSLNEVNEHIPEEYKNELLAVEQNLATSVDSSEEKPASEATSTSDTPSAPVIASIPQQYQEKPSTGETTSGAIYDTDNYHKPVAHPAEQKSGWMWVIVILALIVIGGLLGAAAYFFGLI